MDLKIALSFDDVLLVPQYSTLASRKEADISTCKSTLDLQLPLISSPMTTITESEMVKAMSSVGGYGIIHRYNTPQEQYDILMKCFEGNKRLKIINDEKPNVGIAIGCNDWKERLELCHEHIGSVCIDIAHGHHSLMINTIHEVKEKYPDITLIAGNVATGKGWWALANAGADLIRVGIGGGSICSTRINTGHGVPTFQSIIDVHEYRAKTYHFTHVGIIADGGIRTAGDIVKALAAGADACMVGQLISGTDETPGDIIRLNGREYKSYHGMASREAQTAWRGEVFSPEGVISQVPYRGNVEHILHDVKANVQSGFSYSGARNLEDLRDNAEFIKQTHAGQIESSTHVFKK